MLAVADGKFVIGGFRARHLRCKFLGLASWKISNILLRLRNLGLIKRVAGSYRYYVTALGKNVIVAGLFLKNRMLIPALAKT